MRRPIRLLTLLGTRPEAVKLAPVIAACARAADSFRTVTVASGQHQDLLRPFVGLFDIQVDHDLAVMRPGQTPNGVCARILASLDPILADETPDVVLVQGDTTTALAGALAAFHRRIPVGHVEAGLRSGDPDSPFPEEINRRLISHVARWHFAATERNRLALLGEGIAAEAIHVTGNPVVDAVTQIASIARAGAHTRAALAGAAGRRILVVTTHRRESFGDRMVENLRALRRFVDRHDDIDLLFPVHPNPNVVAASAEVLSNHPRIHLLPPLDYPEFIHLLSQAWLIVSDSGGVQEEAPTLGKPVLVLRDTTERQEAIDAGVAKLVGHDPQRLTDLLDEAAQPDSWCSQLTTMSNPFGDGRSGERIANLIAAELNRSTPSSTHALVPTY
jgi:UDP-N-acetylglucosamine 2-epimerase (non-hydrolysing)